MTALSTTPTSASSSVRPAPARATTYGSLRRITFTNGMPNPPETIADNLQFPDGLGVWKP